MYFCYTYKLYNGYSDESSDDDQKGAFKPVPKLRGRKGYDEREEYERQLREREEEEEQDRVGMHSQENVNILLSIYAVLS